MITERAQTTVVKNKSTARDREFWSHVEAVAEQSRRLRAMTCHSDDTQCSNCVGVSNRSTATSHEHAETDR